jgi:rSAM/selenodomain-associated transferase 1
MAGVMDDRIAVAIFAKAPIEGFAKTRLIPRIGAKAAADIQRGMIERTVRTAIQARLGPVSLWCTPDATHDFFSSVASKYQIELYRQSGSDLGARMLDAFEVLSAHNPVIVIGCDCLTLEASQLDICAAALRSGSDAVFFPAEDGGYVLVAARRPWPELFRNMPWGSPTVMSETRSRAIQSGLLISEPVTLWDVDTPEDFDRAAKLNLLRL